MRRILAIFTLLSAAALAAGRSGASGPAIPTASGSASASPGPSAGAADTVAYARIRGQANVLPTRS